MEKIFKTYLNIVKERKNILFLGFIFVLMFSLYPIVFNFSQNKTITRLEELNQMNDELSSFSIVFLRSVNIQLFVTIFITLFIYLSFFLSKKNKINNVSIVKKIKNKVVLFSMLSGISGGFGDVLIFAMVFLLSASTSSFFYVLLLIYTLIFSKFFLKKKYSFKVWLAIMILIFSIIVIVVIQFVASQETNKNSLSVILGTIFGIVGMGFSSGEALLMDKAFKMNSDLKFRFRTNYLIFWRFFASLLFLSLIISPVLGIVFHFNVNLNTNFNIIFEVFGNSFVGIEFIIMIFLGIINLIAHISYYKTIKLIGADKTNIIEQSQSLMTPIIAGIIFGIVSALNLESSIEGASIYQFPYSVQIWFQPIFWINALIIFICSLYITLYKDKKNENKY